MTSGDVEHPSAFWVCPACKGQLQLETTPKPRLLCRPCRIAYAIEAGIPILLTDQATPI